MRCFGLQSQIKLKNSELSEFSDGNDICSFPSIQKLLLTS